MEAELAFDASFFKANRKVNCQAAFDLSFISHSYFPSYCRVVPLRISGGACAVRTFFYQTLPAALEQAILADLEVAGEQSLISS